MKKDSKLQYAEVKNYSEFKYRGRKRVQKIPKFRRWFFRKYNAYDINSGEYLWIDPLEELLYMFFLYGPEFYEYEEFLALEETPVFEETQEVFQETAEDSVNETCEESTEVVESEIEVDSEDVNSEDEKPAEIETPVVETQPEPDLTLEPVRFWWLWM